MDALVLVLAGVLFVIACRLFLHRRIRVQFARKVDLIPGPVAYPFVGSIGPLLFKKNNDLFAEFLKIIGQQKPIFRMWFGGQPEVYLTRPEHVEVMLSSTRNLQKGFVYKFLHSWLGTGLLTATEETQERRGGALSSEMKMKIFLRYMADPGFQSGIAEEMGIHQTTVSKTVISVSKKIMEKANIWIKFPSSLQDITAAKAEWLQKFNFPSAIGVIDCTHVRIPKPTQHGDEYVNRKGFASINVQATCNAKECFTSVVASWPGSVHDCRIWKNSSVRDVLSGFKNTVLLGDEGYGLEPWLMTPYRNAVQNSHKNFNRLLKKE